MALIYLFEDDTSLRALLVEMLRDELGADVEACANLSELMDRCDARRPDVVVADFWGVSHLHLEDAERREIAALAARAPLLLVSARNWAIGAEPAELGVAALLSKPLDIEQFAVVVQELLPKYAEAEPRGDANASAVGRPQG